MAYLRLPLRSQLWQSWKMAIEEDYQKQLINSENGLQTALIVRLRSLLPEARRVFIEPLVFARGNEAKRWFPDLVVCNSKQVIAVVELKYQPRQFANWKLDLQKLNRIAELKQDLHVANTRYLGPPVDDREYTFASRTLFGWLGVHRPFPGLKKNQVPDMADGHEFLSGCFVQLHALTSSKKDPSLVRKLG